MEKDNAWVDRLTSFTPKTQKTALNKLNPLQIADIHEHFIIHELYGNSGIKYMFLSTHLIETNNLTDLIDTISAAGLGIYTGEYGCAIYPVLPKSTDKRYAKFQMTDVNVMILEISKLRKIEYDKILDGWNSSDLMDNEIAYKTPFGFHVIADSNTNVLVDPVTTFTTGKQLTFIGKEEYDALYMETVTPLETNLKGMWLNRVRQGDIEEGELEPKISEIGFIMKDEENDTIFYSPIVLMEEHDGIES